LTAIAICYISIADSNEEETNVTLGEKLRYLREVEGTLRGLGRTMSQSEVVRAIREERGATISQAYLSQVENGKRKHLTDSSRMLLANFFKVHPGYLVTDPEGYATELISTLRTTEDSLDLWLINGAEQFARDRDVSSALLSVARNEDSRRCLILLGAILEVPDLADRLLQVLKPAPVPTRETRTDSGGSERRAVKKKKRRA
jgi:transcriptional regulator with XRE-family HTH domain